MGYTGLEKLLNVVLKLKYDWISRVDVPYHYAQHDDNVTYYVHLYINKNIFKLTDQEKFPEGVYKMPLNLFEKKTKTNFNFLRKDIDNLFHNQILSGKYNLDIWFFFPKQ
jgi:hypothetical protein